MAEKIKNEIIGSILKHIYHFDGGMKVYMLFNLLEDDYGISKRMFDDIIKNMVEKNECVIENIINLDNEEVKVIFITEEGLEHLEDEDFSVKKTVKNKIPYGLKCEGYSSYAEWIENNRTKLILEKNITRAYSRVWMDIRSTITESLFSLEEKEKILEGAIENLNNKCEKQPVLLESIDMTILLAICAKLLELVEMDAYRKEAKKVVNYINDILNKRHDFTHSFL